MQIIPVTRSGLFVEQVHRTYRAGWVILESLIEPILTNRNGCIVEIGMGASTPMFAKYAQQHKVKLYSCDKNPLKTGQPLFKGHIIFEGISFDFMKQFKDSPAIVFIDGCHDYAVAKKEFEFFLDKLIVGGVIFLHDTLPPQENLLDKAASGDVYKLRQEIEKKTYILNIDIFTWPYTAIDSGLTMVLKKEQDRPYWRQ